MGKMSIRWGLIVAVLGMVGAALACSGNAVAARPSSDSNGSSDGSSDGSSSVRVVVTPASATLAVGEALQFSTVAAGADAASLTWSTLEPSCGTVTDTGYYTAPPAPKTCHVVATSRSDPMHNGIATVNVIGSAPQVQISISPTAAFIGTGESATFTANVTGAADTRVTWEVEEPGCGSIDSFGTYTAPTTVLTCQVVARSVARSTVTATAMVSVSGSGVVGCTGTCLTYEANVKLGSDPNNTATCDLVGWIDKEGKRRRVYLVNSSLQPFYQEPNGGYIQRYEWLNGTTTRQCDNAGGLYGGWGYTVNHGNFSHRAWLDSKEDGYASSARLIRIGDHHAIWEWKTKLGTSGINSMPTVDVTVHYVFKDGEDQFQYAIDFDTSRIAAPESVSGLVGADSRTPYGSLNWDGYNGPVERRSGFRLGADNVIEADLGAMTWQNLTFGSGYALAPFVEVWNTRLLAGVQYDDELGYVQTRLQGKHRGGHGRGSANRGVSGMIQGVDLFDYQMMEYQDWYGERSAWQAAGPTGTGQRGVTIGHENYSVSVLIDRRSERGVQRLVDEANAIQAAGTSLVATTGRVATAGVEAPGVPVLRRWDKPGFDQVYRNWVVVGSNNAAAGTLTVTPGKKLRNPTIVVTDYTSGAKPVVKKDVLTLTEGQDYYVSVSSELQQAWVTFLSSFSDATSFSIAGPSDATGIDVVSFAASPGPVIDTAATTVTFTAEITGATTATLDLSALGGNAAVSMQRSGTTFTASHIVPAGVSGGGPVLVALKAISATGSRQARTSVLVKGEDLVLFSGPTDHVLSGYEPNGHVSKTSAESPFEGTTQLKLAYNGTGVAADIALDGAYDLSRFRFLGIAIRGPTNVGQTVAMELRASGNWGSGMKDYGRMTSYSKLYIPMADFPIDLRGIEGIRLQLNGAAGSGAVYFDDITLTSVAEPATGLEIFQAGYPGVTTVAAAVAR